MKVTRNSVFLLLGDVGSKSVYALIIIAVARLFGDEGLGVFSFAYALASVSLLLADLGLSQIAVREIAQRPSSTSPFIATAAVIKIAATVPALVLLATVAWLARPDSAILHVVLALGGAAALLHLAELGYAVFRARQETQWEASIRFGGKVFALGLSLVALAAGGGLLSIALAVLAGAALEVSLATWVAVRRFDLGRYLPSYQDCRRVIVQTSTFLLFPLLSAAYCRLDLIVLTFLRGDAEVGWYSAAYRVIDFSGFIPVAIAGATLPVLSSLTTQAQRTALARAVFARLWQVTIPFAFLGMLVAPQVMAVFGPAFAPGVPALHILIWAGALLFTYHLAGIMLIALERQAQLTRIVGFAAVLNLILNLIFVPFWGYLGAAGTTLATEAVILVWYYRCLDEVLPGALRPDETLWLLPVGAVAAGASWVSVSGDLERALIFGVLYLVGFGVWRLLVGGRARPPAEDYQAAA